MAHDVNQGDTDVPAQVRSALIQRISSERYDLWISADTTWSWDGQTLGLCFTSEFASQIARKMLGRELCAVAKEQLGECKVDFGFEDRDGEIVEDTVAVEATSSESSKPSAASIPSTSRQADRHASLIPLSEAPVSGAAAPNVSASTSPASSGAPPQKDLWRSIQRGEANQLACTTATLVINDPGRLTPVFLSGPTGCGKSLLAAAITQQLRTTKRMRRVVHMTSEQFTNDFMEGLRGGGLPMFRRKYREVEALVLDDIQFFAGKKSTLAEVKHTLDNLLTQGKQVVCTADRSLNELGALGPDIVGRLRGGLVTPMFPLDASLRADMLSGLLQAEGIEVDEEVIRQLAEKCAGDGRVVGGIAKRLMATASLKSGRLTWEQCWNAVYDLVQATQPVVRIGDIERVVCNVFGLEPQSLQSPSKMRNVSQPRMLAMFLARKYTPAAYKEIGEYFGRRRHSTVISAEKTVESWLQDTSETPVARGMSVRDALRHVESQLQVG
ncbi:MAG: hypothetical protein Aurels2KO_31900 [Aureliella sp.]